MKLQVHQNGAKFPISKVYIDDEQLDSNQTYTLVIIPEAPGLEGIVLTYFDPKIGPTILGARPESICTEIVTDTCITWMATMNKPGFFTASSGSVTGLNYMFEFPDQRVKSGKEIVMLTLLVGNKPSIFFEEMVATTLAQHGEKLKNELENYLTLIHGKEKPDETTMVAAKARLITFLDDAKADLMKALEIQETMDRLGSAQRNPPV